MQTLSDTLAEQKGKGLVSTMTHRLEEEEAETFSGTLAKFRSRCCSTLNDRLGFIEVDKLDDTLDEVEA